MMSVLRAFYLVAAIASLFVCIEATTGPLTAGVGNCLRDLATREISLAYNYLQLSSKFGATNAYPGFASLLTKLSDDDSHKGHELVKFIALRRAKLDRLINKEGIKIRTEVTNTFDVRQRLKEARDQNKDAWIEVTRCHQEADNVRDAHVQDYLESHLLDHHAEVDKLLADIEHRIDEAQPTEVKLITFMIDDELMHTYGDRRKDIFS